MDKYLKTNMLYLSSGDQYKKYSEIDLSTGIEK